MRHKHWSLRAHFSHFADQICHFCNNCSLFVTWKHSYFITSSFKGCKNYFLLLLQQCEEFLGRFRLEVCLEFSGWQRVRTLLCGESDLTPQLPNGPYGTCWPPLSIQFRQLLEVYQCQMFPSTPFLCHVHPIYLIYNFNQFFKVVRKNYFTLRRWSMSCSIPSTSW